MAVSNQQVYDWLLNNQDASDAEIASAMRQYGVSSTQLADVTGMNPADITARYEAALPVAAPASVAVSAPAATQGALATVSTPAAATTSTAASTPATKEDAVAKITQQILAQGTADKWSGEGKGSAEKNAADMAKIIADTGATDISQFGKVTTYAPVEAIGQTYNGQNVQTQYNEDGTTVKVIVKGTGQYDSEGNETYTQVAVPPTAKLDTVYGTFDGENYNAVDPSKVTVKDGQAVVAAGETFGNKVTGTAVASTYGERQTGNAFGGTFDGKGNTGYRVQFNADGSPIFYTTGASSSDIGQLAPILAIASFIPGVAPFAQAINAAIAIKNGDVLGGLASLAGAGGFTDAATGLRVASALDKGDISGLVTSLVNNPSVGALANTTMLTDTISLADAGNALNVGINLNNGNFAGALTAAGQLTGSADTKTAGAALNLVNALNSGNETAIINAAAGLANTANAANNITNTNVATSLINNVTTSAATTALNNPDTAAAATQLLTDLNSAGSTSNLATKNIVSSINDTVSTATGGTGALSTITTDTSKILEDASKYVDTEFGDLQGAIDKNAAERNKPVSFNDAFAANRLLKGANDTFEWTNPKTGVTGTYKTGTAAEADAAIAALNAKNLATTTPELQAVIKAQNDTAARNAGLDATAARVAALNTKTTGLGSDVTYDALGNVTSGSLNLAPEGGFVDKASTVLGNVVQNSLANTAQALGEQGKALTTAVNVLTGTSTNNSLNQAFNAMESFGKTIQTASSKAEEQAIIDAVTKADTVGDKIAAFYRAAIANPFGAAGLIGREALQEILPIGAAGLAGKTFGAFAGMATDRLLNAGESLGGTYDEVYKAAIAKGMSEDQAASFALKAGGAAFGITALTSGLFDSKAVSKFIGEEVGTAASKIAKGSLKEGVSEFTEEAATSAASQYITTGKVDANTMFTQGVLGAGVGKTTAASLGTVGSIENSLNTYADANGLATTGSTAPVTQTALAPATTTGALATGDATGTTGALSTVGADTTGTTNVAGDTGATTNVTGADTGALSTVGSNVGADTAVDTGPATLLYLGSDGTTAIVADANGVSSVVNVAPGTNVGSQVKFNPNAGVLLQSQLPQPLQQQVL